MSDVNPEDFEVLRVYDKLRTLDYEHKDCLELLETMRGLDDQELFGLLYIAARKHWTPEVASKHANNFLEFWRGR